MEGEGGGDVPAVNLDHDCAPAGTEDQLVVSTGDSCPKDFDVDEHDETEFGRVDLSDEKVQIQTIRLSNCS